MANIKMLRDTIQSKGIKLEAYATALGITTAGLRKKMDGASDFKASEIIASCDFLHLSNSERDKIFLSDR